MPWPLLEAALGRALDELVERRTAEGERLAQELRSLHAELDDHRGHHGRAGSGGGGPARGAAARAARARCWADAGVDEARILTEAAVWADKGDITEELTRLRAHLAEWRWCSTRAARWGGRSTSSSRSWAAK